MPKTITLKISEDEAEIILDALDVDLEGYVDAAKDARANQSRSDVQTFEEAAGRIREVQAKIRAELDRG